MESWGWPVEYISTGAINLGTKRLRSLKIALITLWLRRCIMSTYTKGETQPICWATLKGGSCHPFGLQEDVLYTMVVQSQTEVNRSKRLRFFLRFSMKSIFGALLSTIIKLPLLRYSQGGFSFNWDKLFWNQGSVPTIKSGPLTVPVRFFYWKNASTYWRQERKAKEDGGTSTRCDSFITESCNWRTLISLCGSMQSWRSKFSLYWFMYRPFNKDNRRFSASAAVHGRTAILYFVRRSIGSIALVQVEFGVQLRRHYRLLGIIVRLRR